MNNLIKLYYSANNINFGDQLSRYLIEKITGKYTSPAKSSDNGKLVAIGSLLTSRVLLSKSIIWGTGTLTKASITKWPKSIFPINRCAKDIGRFIFNYTKQPCSIKAVRGPLTRKQIKSFGYDCPEIYGDPAILLPQFYNPIEIRKKHKTGLILHSQHELILDKNFLENLDIHVIPIKRKTNSDIEAFIDEICSCSYIFSSSLHGLITAIAYEIPCQWLRIHKRSIHADEEYKFYDFFSGANIPPFRGITLENLSYSQLNLLNASKTEFRHLPKDLSRLLLNNFPDKL